MIKTPRENNDKTLHPKTAQQGTLEKLTITRRDFLKATALTGVAAALYGPAVSPRKGLAKVKGAIARETEETLIKSACRQCYGRCGIIGHVRDARLVKIEGYPEAPNNLGRLCAKAYAIPQMVYQPARIKYPMKRAGAKGEEKWQRISWDEAYELVASKFKEIRDKYGGIAIANFRGTGRDFVWGDFFTWFNNALGSYIGSSTGHICFVSAVAESKSMLGDENLVRGADIPNAKMILWWGKNAFGRDHTPAHSRQALDAIQRGVKFVEIDPRFTMWASKADLWLPVRPGTDVALALAMIKIILDEKLYDEEFVTKWTDGPFLVHGETNLYVRSDGTSPAHMVWDETTNSAQPADKPGVKPALFGSYNVDGVSCKPVFQLLTEVVQEWTPGKASEVTWVPADRIRQAALLYGQNSPGACIATGHKKDCGINASCFTHALNILVSITGNLETQGGNIFSPDMGVRAYGFPVYGLKPGYGPKVPPTPPPKEASTILGRFPFTRSTDYQFEQIVNSGTPFAIKAAFCQTSNPLLGQIDARAMYAALKKLDFIVVVDWANTPMTALADVILPASTPAEVNGMDISCTSPLPNNLGLLISRQKMVEPLGEAKDDCTILVELAKRLGLSRDTFLPFDSREQYMDWLLEPSGITFDQLREKGFVQRKIEYKRYETGSGSWRPDGKPGFLTTSGRVQLYSEIMLKRGRGPLPVYVEPPESPYSAPELAREYPLICIAGARDPHGYAYFHTEYENVPWLRDIHPYPTVFIHPDTAKSLNITEGDWAWIETRKGRIRMMARVSKQVHPQMVSADHDGWYPEKPGTDPTLYGVWDSNVNVLTSGDGPYDPATGSSLVTGFLCKMYKAAEGAPEGIAQVVDTRTL